MNFNKTAICLALAGIVALNACNFRTERIDNQKAKPEKEFALLKNHITKKSESQTIDYLINKFNAQPL